MTCADSGIDPGFITRIEPGGLLICRNADNIIPSHPTTSGVTASIEYVVAGLG